MINNNNLLKPNLAYLINVDEGYIIIDEEKYAYDINTDALGIKGKDIISTCDIVGYVRKHHNKTKIRVLRKFEDEVKLNLYRCNENKEEVLKK